MNQPIELLSILYELSLTNVQHQMPDEKAKNFIKKILSRRSLQAGSVWIIYGSDGKKLKLKKLYATPDAPSNDYIDLSRFESLFRKDDFVVVDKSLLSERKMEGSFAYFNLNDFAIMELYHNGSTSIDFTRESFLPYQDVISLFGTSIESGFFYQKLQKEIEQRQSAEKSLKNSEEKYRRIIDNIQLGLLEVDNDEIIKHANKSFLELTGYHLEEVIGQKASDLLLDKEAKEVIAKQNTLRKEGASSSYEIKIKDKNGQERWAIISGAPNYDKDGNVIGSIGIHLDITSEKKLRQENAFKSNQLEKLFERSLDGLISINSKGEVFEWSPQASKIFGYTKDEILGKKLSDTIIPHVHREGHESGMKNYLKTGHGPVLNTRIEIVGMRKTGEVFPIELTVFPLEHEEDKYFTAFVRDITEIKESRENMEQALERQKELNQMKSQFISMTSHELRTPLTTIRSNTELLNYQIENPELIKPEKLKKNVSRIENNVERLNHLINNILMIGKLDSDKIPFDPRPIDVERFIKESILPDFESRNQVISCEQEGKPFKVNLDEQLFRHIMTNLLENAVKYSPDGNPPVVRLMFKEGLEIHVIDYGIGIPEDELPKLFDTFFRASNVDNIQGTGLGLSIVKQFVKIHKGDISVKSEIGKGSTFILNFPNT